MKKKYFPIYAIFIYIGINLLSLSNFPPMHSDEGWLASLSRSIYFEKNIAAGEDFLHEVKSNPHAIKILFHLIQIPFIYISYSLVSVRVLSLIAASITLWFLFKTALILFKNQILAVMFIILIALDIEFIYISHFARQEIIILMIFSICLYLFFKPIKKWKIKNDILIGSILGISIGIHPNIFIIVLSFIILYLFYSIINHKKNRPEYPSFINLGILIITLTLFGLAYIGLSFLINPDFLSEYVNFGNSVGVTKPLIIKVLKFPRFFKKMFFHIGGTYYLPNIRPQMLLFVLSFITLIPVSIFYKNKRIIIFSSQLIFLGIMSGILIIGKYSPPSIIFIFIPGYFLFFILMTTLIKSTKGLLSIYAILIFSTFVFSLSQVLPFMNVNYDNYINKIETKIPKDSKTLANLNTVFAFSPDKLYTFRDLKKLNSGFTFRNYTEKYNIKYIIYSEELKIIFDERPVWNTMYGNIYPWYPDMMDFIKTDCTEIAEWKEPVFGMRITSYQGKKNGKIRIYKIVKNK